MSNYIFWTAYGQARPYADHIWAGKIMVSKGKTRAEVIGRLIEELRFFFAADGSHEPFEPYLERLDKTKSLETTDEWAFSVRKEWEG